MNYRVYMLHKIRPVAVIKANSPDEAKLIATQISLDYESKVPHEEADTEIYRIETTKDYAINEED